MRLIDADILKKPIYAEEDNITGSGMGYGEMEGYNDGINVTWSRIINAPTVDAVPVARGHWIPIMIPNGVSAYGVDEMTCEEEVCSVCCEKYWVGEKKNYCPNCGADMRERRTE